MNYECVFTRACVKKRKGAKLLLRPGKDSSEMVSRESEKHNHTRAHARTHTALENALLFQLMYSMRRSVPTLKKPRNLITEMEISGWGLI